MTPVHVNLAADPPHVIHDNGARTTPGYDTCRRIMLDLMAGRYTPAPKRLPVEVVARHRRRRHELDLEQQRREAGEFTPYLRDDRPRRGVDPKVLAPIVHTITLDEYLRRAPARDVRFVAPRMGR